MASTLKNKFFKASREMYGDNSVKYADIELSLTNESYDSYDDSRYGFDWGNSEKGSKLLASAILKKIASPTISRIYTDKYTRQVISKIHEDNWSLEAMEVAKWINSNTEYEVALDEINEDEELQAKHKKKIEEEAKEARKIQREKKFQEEIKNRLHKRGIKEREAQEEQERQKEIEKKEKERKEKEQKKLQELEAQKLDTQNVEELKEYKAKVIKYQNELKKYKLKIDEYESEIIEYKSEVQTYKELLEKQNIEIEKYKEFVWSLDVPSLYKKFNAIHNNDIT